MDPAPTLSAELWRPPHLAAGGGSGRAVEASSAVTGQSNGSRGGGAGRRRQRESAASEDDSSRLVSTSGGGGQLLIDSEAKCFKAIKSSGDDGSLRTEAEADSRNASKAGDQNPPPAEPPKQDYIHVRARRGQATDSHSLAERARREKISERMKILQDLVPGCNKVIGKASVLDEIINYIQALQRQVEFLSMKLEAVNAHVKNGIEAFPSKDHAALGKTVKSSRRGIDRSMTVQIKTQDDGGAVHKVQEKHDGFRSSGWRLEKWRHHNDFYDLHTA